MERAEALHELRCFIGQLTEGCQEVLETLIPELRESEDEKIRKWIYNLVSNLDPQNDDAEKELDEMKPLALTWLEKQKEQKPNIEICPHSIRSKSYKENGYPIEDCDYGLEIAFDILEKTFGEVRGYQTDDGIREHQTAIEAVRKAKEQKPAEVDESTKRLNDNWMKQHFDDYEEQKPAQSREEILHQLFQSGSISLSDYLYLTGEQKPAEWGEEDEKKIHFLSRLIELQVKDDKYCFGDGSLISKQEAIEMLNSLRPSWKPSMEQMNTLLSVEGILRSLQYDDKAKILASIYEQLKKLM